MAATYTVKEVANILGYSTNSIYTFLKEKRIKGVRVGKGRFRIPKSEVDRLLATEKSKQAPDVVANRIIESPIDPRVGVQEHRPVTLEEIVTGSASAKLITVPGLYDWFMGMASIVLGLSMMLFASGIDAFTTGAYGVLLSPLRVTFIAAGAGLLMSDITGRAHTMWRMVFYGLLMLAFGVLTGILMQLGDLVSATVFAPVVFISAAHTLVGIGSIASVSLVASAVVVFVPLVLYLTNAHVMPAALQIVIGVHPAVFITLWIVFFFIVSWILLWSYRTHRLTFWFVVTVIAGVFVGLSLWFSYQIQWSVALYVLVLGLVALFTPTWDSLQFTYKADRKYVFVTFGIIVCLFGAAIGVVQILQANMLSYASSEVENKVVFGKIVVENALDTAQTTIESIAANDVVVEDLRKGQENNAVFTANKTQKDSETPQVHAQDVIRGIFEADSGLQRVYIADHTGEVISAYPLRSSLREENISARAYFQQAIATGKTVLLEQFEAGSAVSPSQLVIASPVRGDNGFPLGVVIGIVDIARLGEQVQQVAAPALSEYFILTDAHGSIIVHPDPERIGRQIEQGSPLSSDRRMGSVVFSSDTGDVVIAAGEVIDRIMWRVGVYAPVVSVLSVTGAATIVVFALVVVSVLLVVVFGLLRRQYRLQMTVGGSGP